MLRELQPWQLGRAAGPPAPVGLFQLYFEGATKKFWGGLGPAGGCQIPNLPLLLDNGSCKQTRHVHPSSSTEKAFACTAGVWIALCVWEAAPYLALIAVLITLIPLRSVSGGAPMMRSLATLDHRALFYLLAGITFQTNRIESFCSTWPSSY